MTLTFIVIGLLCNSAECYWTKVEGLVSFTTTEACLKEAALVKQVTIIFHDTACMVTP